MNAIKLPSWLPERIVIAEATTLLLIALATFFFLAPGHEEWGVVASLASWAWQWAYKAKGLNKHWLIPTFVTVGLLFLSSLCENQAVALHLRAVAFGFLTLISVYRMVRDRVALPVSFVLYAVALPLVMHLMFFLAVIPQHLLNAEIGSQIVRIESLRNAAQIGPKLLSQTLALLIAISYYKMFCGDCLRRLWSLVFCCACICLALLDSRAAYIVLAAGIILASILRHRIAHQKHKDAPSAKTEKHLRQLQKLILGIGILCIVLATAVGWHRFKNLESSLRAGWHHEAYTSWITPETWVKEFCPPTQERCVIDNSIYLRLAWIKFGGTVIVDHPFGLGPSIIPLARALNTYYPKIAATRSIYDSAHSGVMDIGISYGIPGIALFLILIFLPLHGIIRQSGEANPPAYLPLLACLWTICITRTVIDGLAMSLWFLTWLYAGYVLALARPPHHPKISKSGLFRVLTHIEMVEIGTDPVDRFNEPFAERNLMTPAG